MAADGEGGGDAAGAVCRGDGGLWHVVTSVPLRHSWKPPLDRVLEAHARRLGLDLGGVGGGGVAQEEREGARLELFARELRAGWTSVGDEAVLFQMRSFFASEAPRG